MKNHIFSIGLLAALAISCSIHEMDFKETNAIDEFYASIENTENLDTKVYATEELYLRWNADDRITIFNKYTYNQEYRFTGETGDNSGSFKRVDNGDFVTGNSLDNIYAIYPYLESTRISDTGVITVTLPAEQKFAENTMGLGANTMVSATTDNQLLFKNVGGYLMLKLYGDDVTVSSITLKGNNGERIAGKATVSMPINSVPTVVMSETAGQEITLVCETPVKIGSTAETATTFWIVVPPTVFSKGFTLTVMDNKNGIFEKATSKSFEIGRNKLARMSALEVSLEYPDPSDEAIVFADEKVKAKLVAAFDTNGDGELSYAEAAAVSSGDDLKAALGAIKTYKSFDEFQYFTGVTIIPNSMFEEWVQLTSIILPENLVRIGNSAFKGCTKLSSITLPSGVTDIWREAFSGCILLESIEIPDGVTYLYENAFNGCENLSSVILSNRLTTIERGVFKNCTSLKKIIIPNSVTGIQDGATSTVISSFTNPSWRYGAFEGCTSLKEVVLSESLEVIGSFTFWGCTSLSSISIPKSVKRIGAGAFSYCSSIMSLALPNSVNELGEYAFYKCSSLSSFILSNSLSRISNYAFYECSCLTSIVIPDNISSIEEYALSGTGLTCVIIPESVSVIGNAAFSGCTDLTSIIFPESVTKIGDRAFGWCTSLMSIVIPESVTNIGDRAFFGCTSLTSIIVNSPIPPSGYSQMFDSTNNCPIYVPAESIDAYKSAQYWSDYADRIRPLPVAVDLGLSVKWASFNLGASKPEEFGDYYAWGETEPYYSSLDPLTWKEGKEDGYAWSSYKWCMGTYKTLTKYCYYSYYGFEGFTDSRTVLDPEDDAAHMNLGDKWRMPTDGEWTELLNNCSSVWTEENGVSGCRFTSKKNGDSIFLPAAKGNANLNVGDSYGFYWSSSLSMENNYPISAQHVYFRSDGVYSSATFRYSGYSVRPVYAE